MAFSRGTPSPRAPWTARWASPSPPPPAGAPTAYHWIAAGRDYAAVRELDRKVKEKTAQRMMDRTEAYWRLWVDKEPLDPAPLPAHLREFVRRSALVVRTQIDHGGAIIAANDHDITRFAGDTYSYMWPRDGAGGACPGARRARRAQPELLPFLPARGAAGGILPAQVQPHRDVRLQLAPVGH